MKCLFFSCRFCWVKKRDKRGMRNFLFSLLNRSSVVLFNLVLNTIHMCIIVIFLLILSFVNLWSISANKSERKIFSFATNFHRKIIAFPFFPFASPSVLFPSNSVPSPFWTSPAVSSMLCDAIFSFDIFSLEQHSHCYQTSPFFSFFSF